MKILTVAFMLLFNYLDTFPKLCQNGVYSRQSILNFILYHFPRSKWSDKRRVCNKSR